MQLFYSEDISQNELILPKDESRHLIQVLRKEIGDEVHFTDGLGNLLLMEVISDHPKKAILKVKKREVVPPSKQKLTIAIAPTKNIDRLEWFLEKSTEIGIDTIIPFTGEHSERKVIKSERLEKILVSAMKQSLRFYKPSLSPLKSFKEVIELDFSGQKIICHQDEKSKDLGLILKKDQDVLILIGPEGDFSTAEIKSAKERGFVSGSLGNHRLRTETAGVVSCQIFNSVHN